MVSPSPEMTLPPLVGTLEETLQALGHLHATASRLRPTDSASAGGFPAFSPLELDRLRTVIRQGGASVTRRLKELVGEKPEAARLPELWREGVARTDLSSLEPGIPTAEARSRALLSAYRATCRSLCASLQEAKRTCDGATAVMLSGLLHRLEKQLWLLDSSPERVRVGLPTIDLFLSC